MTETEIVKIVDRIHSEIVDLEVKRDNIHGGITQGFIYGAYKVVDLTLAITIKVNPMFMLQLKNSKHPIIVSALDFRRKPFTLFSIPIYVEATQKEKYNIIER